MRAVSRDMPSVADSFPILPGCPLPSDAKPRAFPFSGGMVMLRVAQSPLPAGRDSIRLLTSLATSSRSPAPRTCAGQASPARARYRMPIPLSADKTLPCEKMRASMEAGRGRGGPLEHRDANLCCKYRYQLPARSSMDWRVVSMVACILLCCARSPRARFSPLWHTGAPGADKAPRLHAGTRKELGVYKRHSGRARVMSIV